MNHYLEIDHVGMTFPTDSGPLNVLENVDLKVDKGEFVTLIGHSGCGKSTVLNIVAGLLEATEGGIVLEGRQVTEPGPDRAVVFQNHSLLPWLSVYDNVRLAVDRVFRRSKSRRERDEWTRHNLELVHMTHALGRKPDEISGGMKQRVGIARALAMEPKVLLMDEPFGALDSLTRTHMQDTLMEIQARLNNTVIMITHDVDEAVLLSDRIVMMSNGPSASIGETLQVDILRPRDRLELAEDPVYNHYRAEVVKFLHERHAFPSAPSAARPSPPADAPPAVLNLAQWRDKRQSGGSGRPEKTDLVLGFIPLTDCAPLVVAKEKGYFAKHGLNVELSRESSWANIRDKVSVGMLDGAQMLAGMPLAGACGLDSSVPMVTALSLDLNGNGITVSNELHERLLATGAPALDTPLGSARALKRVIEEHRQAGGRPLVFATVFPYSAHNYLLRYWMAAGGIDPDRDVRLTVVPPPQMVNYLRAGVISGFCVGEPWNTQAVMTGLGHILAASYDLWNNHPEKVFGVSWTWAAENPNTHTAALAALLEASAWVDEQRHRTEVCEILSQGRYVNTPAELLEMSMTGTFRFAATAPPRARPDFNVFHRYAASFPWRSHAVWLLTQMLRWGQLGEAENLRRIAASVYLPDLYRRVAETLGMAFGQADYKDEGRHTTAWSPTGTDQPWVLGADAFFDGRTFSAGDPVAYLKGFDIRHMAVALDALSAANPVWSEEERLRLVADDRLDAALVGEAG
ncbi:MAG: nitrate ABC transporter ATP-binding protein [Gammaproteobacteria bacterium]|nr:nitrate ABC transporter ATP-binding protein [Gammaproteobacteria bacterium]